MLFGSLTRGGAGRLRWLSVAVVALPRAVAGRACSGRRGRLWRGRRLSLTGRRPVAVARPGPRLGGAAPAERAVAVPRVDPRVGRVGSLATCRGGALVRRWQVAAAGRHPLFAGRVVSSDTHGTSARWRI